MEPKDAWQARAQAWAEWDKANPEPELKLPEAQPLEPRPAQVIQHAEGRFWVEAGQKKTWRNSGDAVLRLHVTEGNTASEYVFTPDVLPLLLEEITRAIAETHVRQSNWEMENSARDAYYEAREKWTAFREQIGAAAFDAWETAHPEANEEIGF